MLVRAVIISLVMLFQVHAGAYGSSGTIELMAGFDGANPQSQADIIMESARRFRVRPFNEPGSNDAYWFRLNTLILNNGSRTEDVELIVEWPVLQRHPDYPYDYYFYGDMGDWHAVRATVKGAEALLVVPARPGQTFVGFYPRYSYGYYLQFMESLSDDSPLLAKWMQGKSARGREIWCVRLTDPEAPAAGKAKILLTARNHPYETSCSFIAEEVVRYLLGGCEDARRVLRENDVYVVPMMNPDGVALGMNQRTGPDGVNMSYAADTDVPEIVALQSLVGKVRPDIWVDVHSWPHEGDDGMWCTHQWVADGLLAELPDSSFQDYVWNVSFVRERGTADNHLWQWLIRSFDSGGVSLSFSWFRRTEEDIRMIGPRLIVALGEMMSKR
jgi:Zinc carboxypeptidase